MSSNHIKQNGSFHVIIVIAIVLAMVGTLGIAYWLNISKSNKSQTHTSTVTLNSSQQSAPKTPGYKSVSFNPAFGVVLKTAYPTDWTASSTMTGPVPLNASKGYTSETLTITAPSKQVYVRYVLMANGGLGGSCMPEYSGKVASLKSVALTNFVGVSFTEWVFNEQTGYNYFAGLMDTARVATAKVGGSYCNLYLADIIKMSDTNNLDLLEARIHIKSLDAAAAPGGKGIKALADVQAWHANSEYTQAQAIVQATEFHK